ncbi:MAG: MATE family efflux transporter [Dorea sp.]
MAEKTIALGMPSLIAQVSAGVQPLLSDFYGRNERTGIRKVLHYAMWTMLIFSLVIYGLLFVFARSVTSVFNSEHNQELQNIAVTGLKIYFLSNVFAGYNMILATYFISVEKAVPLRSCLFSEDFFDDTDCFRLCLSLENDRSMGSLSVDGNGSGGDGISYVSAL